jgi:uncharacterized protein YlbG (UPF0298 family)
MKILYKIDHTSLAILLGDAQNSKSFADNSWGKGTYSNICEKFYQMYLNDREIDIEKISSVIETFKIDGRKSFDNFALNFVQEHLKENSNIKY